MKSAWLGSFQGLTGVLVGVLVTIMAAPASAFVFTNNGGDLNEGVETVFTFNVSGVPLERISLTIDELQVPNLSSLQVFLSAPVPVGSTLPDSTIQLFGEFALSNGATMLRDTVFDDAGSTFITDPLNLPPYSGTFRPQGSISSEANTLTFNALQSNLTISEINAPGEWRLRVTDFSPANPIIPSRIGRITLRVPFNMQSTAGMIILATIWVGHRLRQRRVALSPVS